MEVMRSKSKDGRVYRIIKMSAYDVWEIEYKKEYKYTSGEVCTAWFAAFEPRQRLFTSLSETKQVFNQLLEGVTTL